MQERERSYEVKRLEAEKKQRDKDRARRQELQKIKEDRAEKEEKNNERRKKVKKE